MLDRDGTRLDLFCGNPVRSGRTLTKPVTPRLATKARATKVEAPAGDITGITSTTTLTSSNKPGAAVSMGYGGAPLGGFAHSPTFQSAYERLRAIGALDRNKNKDDAGGAADGASNTSSSEISQHSMVQMSDFFK